MCLTFFPQKPASLFVFMLGLDSYLFSDLFSIILCFFKYISALFSVFLHCFDPFSFVNMNLLHSHDV